MGGSDDAAAKKTKTKINEGMTATTSMAIPTAPTGTTNGGADGNEGVDADGGDKDERSP